MNTARPGRSDVPFGAAPADGTHSALLDRRRFATLAGQAAAALMLATACRVDAVRQHDGRLRARPRRNVKTTASGRARLGLGARRDATLQMPADTPGGPLPLMVLLHGAGGTGEGILARLGTFATAAGLVVLSPDARGSTWDAIRGDFGPDAEFINRCLERVFEQMDVDARRISIAGFSDGATYALSLGLRNGELFRRIIAWSPGFYVGGEGVGKPRIYISHGTEDDVLPIDRCSRRIIPTLKRNGYEVTYKEFTGGHTIPADIAAEGVRFAAEV